MSKISRLLDNVLSAISSITQKPRVQAFDRELKTLRYDEFHRTGQGFSTMLPERIKVFVREGRKWNIQIMLSSQRLGDLPINRLP